MKTGQAVWIKLEPAAGFQEQLAARELARGLRKLALVHELLPSGSNKETEERTGEVIFVIGTSNLNLGGPEEYKIATEPSKGKATQINLTSSSPQAILYAVFDFLERQGAFFGLGGEVYPPKPKATLNLPDIGHPWVGKPRFKVRGILPWSNFLCGVTVFNRENYRTFLEALLRMRFNQLAIHVYSGDRLTPDHNEAFLSFQYAGVGHMVFSSTSANHQFANYLPQRTSDYGMGSPNYFENEVFGSTGVTKVHNGWEAAELTQQTVREAFDYARQLGIQTGIGFEVYEIPDDILSATPPEVILPNLGRERPGPRVDPESLTSKNILEARLGRLLEGYPSVDYIWLWEDEDMTWASRDAQVQLSTTPFKQTHEFLRKHAPKTRLVMSGWGGVVRHFSRFHGELPEDVIFTCLSDDVGWTGVSEEFAKLHGRERWPILWLEDDSSMWMPQFHVRRFHEDMDRAEQFGCQGVLGQLWRTRIMDTNAGFQSRYSWDKQLRPDEYFRAFAAAQAEGSRAEKLAQILDETDRDQTILCTYAGEGENGHPDLSTWAGGFNQGFEFWRDQGLPDKILKSQAEVARSLHELTVSSSNRTERERLNYLAKQVEFLLPYCDSWGYAHHLHAILQEANDLKKRGRAEDARQKVMAEGIPLWLQLAPKVREAILDFQEVVGTRDELGNLAAMHNKYERLALFRLRASMKEFLGELPREVERLFDTVRLPDQNETPRVFVPAPPTIIASGQSFSIFAVAPGGKAVTRTSIHTRSSASKDWSHHEMKPVGRRTFTTEIRALEADAPFIDYYVRAEFITSRGNALATAPVGGPHDFYTVTIAEKPF